MIFTQFTLIWVAIFLGLILSILYFGFQYFVKQKSLRNTYSLLLKNDSSSLQMLFIALSIILLTFGLFWPQTLQNEENQSIDGIDIIIVLDVSKSMNAFDFEDSNNYYSRIDAAKLLVKNYVINNPQNRYWLVVFAWDSVNVSPLTSDQDIFLNFLKSVDYRNVSAQGSNLAQAYELWIKRLSVDSESSALIMMSDGGDSDDTLNAAAIKNSYNLQKNYTVVLWFWTREWAKIPDWQDLFWYTNYQTFQWEEIITRLNEKNLQKIADLTNGDYIAIKSLEDINEIESKLSDIETKAIESGQITDYTDMRRMLCFFAFFFFIIYLIVPLWKSSHIRHT